jgi:hypothetical protein
MLRFLRLEVLFHLLVACHQQFQMRSFVLRDFK